MKVVIIGGGPAGMMAAIRARELKNDVLILEKMKMMGRKLLITGKGRCNITSSLSMEEFIENIPGNGKFLYSCFKNFTNRDIIDFLKKQGLQVKEERGNRVFPVTDRSIDVLKCFEDKIKEMNIDVMYNANVTDIVFDKILMKVTGVIANGQKISADKVILATGGMSYPLTGSTGDGYKMAERLGHTINSIKPSLVPYEVFEQDIVRELQGLSLKNVEINIKDINKNKNLYNDFGEMIFTHFGLSGPIILSSSSHLVRIKNINDYMKNKNIKIFIDFKPALSIEKLRNRVIRDFDKYINKQFKNALNDLLPKKLIPIVIEKSGIDGEKQVNQITKMEREELISVLKEFELTIKDFRPIEEAIITSGGVSIKEINPKTMESKLAKGLYFAGEIIDVDAYTGGFNLQIAYSTGYTAGNNM